MKCPACLARIEANAAREPSPLRGMASTDCTCDPLARHYVGRREWQDIMPPRDAPCASPDPGRFTDESIGLWSRCIRAMEDAA